MAIHVFHIDEPDRMMPMIARDARLVVWAGRGSQTANMNYVDMQPGERNIPHVHELQCWCVTNSNKSIRYSTHAHVHLECNSSHKVLANRGHHHNGSPSMTWSGSNTCA